MGDPFSLTTEEEPAVPGQWHFHPRPMSEMVGGDAVPVAQRPFLVEAWLSLLLDLGSFGNLEPGADHRNLEGSSHRRSGALFGH